MYKEAKVATLFDAISLQSYHDNMLALIKLFNQAYPDENHASHLKPISKWLILGMGDHVLAQYLVNQAYSGPMELIQLAETCACLFKELRSANHQPVKVADA